MNHEFARKIGDGKRVSLHTLGCKLNYAETSTLAKDFQARGFQVVPFGDESEIVLLNTCTVTENAERECRQLVRRALRTSPNAVVAVTGCYAQLRPNEIAAIEGVDIILGANEKFSIFDLERGLTKKEQPLILVGDLSADIPYHTASTAVEDSRSRTFLKIQDGCDYSCSFCTIPQARGASRSARVEEVVEQAITLCRQGFHEIVLTGVNVGDFGRSTGGSLLTLLQELESCSEITARIRISSIEPNLLKQEIIDHVANSTKVCAHFHLPLQSGSSRVLRAMQRRYNRELYSAKVAAIKRAMPHAAIGADVIVGFPGETDREFEETYEFIQQIEVSYLHVFTYSERPGTPAPSMAEPVPLRDRKLRNERLRMLSDKKREAFYAEQRGRQAIAILERQTESAAAAGVRYGYTENFVRVELEEEGGAEGDVVLVLLLEHRGDFVRGQSLQIVSRRRDPLALQLPVLA